MSEPVVSLDALVGAVFAAWPHPDQHKWAHIQPPITNNGYVYDDGTLVGRTMLLGPRDVLLFDCDHRGFPQGEWHQIWHLGENGIMAEVFNHPGRE